MATVSGWNPFGVSLDVTATSGTLTRTSATQYTVKINASWKTYYSGAKTNYGMTASSGGGSVTLNPFGTYASSGSSSFTGTYSISGNGSATKTITVTFKNFNTDNDESATTTVSFSVTVPAWTSYTVSYNANGGSGNMDSQTVKWNETFTLSNNSFAREGHKFIGWNSYRNSNGKWYVTGQGWLTEDEILAGGYTKKLYENQEELLFDASWSSENDSNQSFTMYAIWEISGVVYIDNGITFEPYLAYIDNGTSWDLYLAYVDNGTSWMIIS